MTEWWQKAIIDLVFKWIYFFIYIEIMSSFISFVSANQNEIIILLSISSFLLFCLFIYVYTELGKIKKKNGIFFAGKDAKSLEDIVLEQVSKGREMDTAITRLQEADRKIIEQLSFAVQKIGVVRFNPFGDVGGNQSFAVAMLDNHNSGVIILSLYSRDGVRIYGKPVMDGQSEYKLSEEEIEALKKAMGQ